MKYHFITAGLIIFSVLAFSQNDWPQYLGPKRNASATEVKIARSWPENGPRKLWTFPLGQGFGGVSIDGDEVFILDRITGKTDILRCIEFSSGKEKWSYSYDAPGELPYPGSRSVPTVDDEFVWAVGPLGHFHCFSRETRKPVWSVNILEEFGAERPNWGVAQSPLLYGDLVIIAPQGKKAGIAAFDKRTGNVAWTSRSLSGTSGYVSPVLAHFGGVDQVVMISPYDRKDSTKLQEVVSIEASTGKELWKYSGLRSFLTISPVTIIDDKRLFITDCSYNDGYEPVSIMLQVVRDNGIFKATELFKTEEAGCKMHPAVFTGNHFYMNSTKNPMQMTCLNPDGMVVWKNNEAPGFELGSMILIGDLIVNQNGKNGDLYLIEPSPSGYVELAKASLFNSEKSLAWSPMAFSNGKLIARDSEQMICIDLQNP